MIKTQNSPHADCLDTWRKCVDAKDNKISEKSFDKLWINFYIRFDTCTPKEKKQGYKKCSMENFDYIMENKKHIWDLNHPILDDIKNFLRLFDTE